MNIINKAEIQQSATCRPGMTTTEFINLNSTDLVHNVAIKLYDADGNIVDKHDGHNLVMNNGRVELVKRLCGDSNNFVTHCAVGTGGVSGADPFTPITPVATAGALSNEVFRKAISTKVYGAAGAPSVTITTLFLSSEVNSIISESGLFMASTGGIMFARYTFPSMYLKSDRGYSLEVAWTIQF